MNTKTITLALAALLCAGSAQSRIINVPDDHATIQGGIDASQAGDTVLVQPGTYQECLTCPVFTLTLGSMTLMTGDPAYIDSTVIDARQQGSVILAAEGRDDLLLIRGFTIKNGSSQQGAGIRFEAGRPLFLQDLLITENVAQFYGGGVWLRGGRVTMERVTFRRNRVTQAWGEGGAIIVQGSTLFMDHCLLEENDAWEGGAISSTRHITATYTTIVNNNSDGAFGGVLIWAAHGEPSIFDHCTITGNTGRASGFMIGTYENGDYEFLITNSIIWGNDEPQLLVGYTEDHRMGRDESDACHLEIKYSDLQGGQEGIQVVNDGEIAVGEGVIDADPLFVDAANGNYHLTDNSPCIDAGDPDGPPDRNGGRADLGAFDYDPINAWVCGRVFDLATGDPFAEVMIWTRRGFVLATDSLGVWNYPVRGIQDSERVQLNFSVREYLTEVIDTLVHVGDSLWFDVGLRHGEVAFNFERDTLVAQVGGDAGEQVFLTFHNPGNGPLTWHAAAGSVGEAALPPWSLRRSLSVSQITGDERIEGAVFDGTNYFLSGANGDDSNLVYVLDSEGALLRSFVQAGTSHYGYKDMEFDDNGLIWGSGDSLIYGQENDGHLRRRWRGPLNPTNSIAFDPQGILWLCSQTTNILAYDLDGNDLGRSVNRNDQRIYGLAWNEDDPDTCKLYATVNPGGGAPSQIVKFNTETGEMRVAYEIPPDSGMTAVNNGSITQQFDRYRSVVMLTVANIAPAHGGDRLDIWQVQPNDTWLTVSPDSGVVEAGGAQDLTVTFTRSVAGYGDYLGEISITHDGRGGETVLPVLFLYENWDGLPSEPVVAPGEFGITELYPNPFNSVMTIRFSFAAINRGKQRLAVYGLDGRMVDELWTGRDACPPEERQAGRLSYAGERSVTWNAAGLPGGIYFVTLESTGVTMTVKAVLVK